MKKENKFTMTDLGRYAFDNNEIVPQSAKEWTLKRNLEDAEMLIQDHKHTHADLNDQLKHAEEKVKMHEMDFKAARRE